MVPLFKEHWKDKKTKEDKILNTSPITFEIYPRKIEENLNKFPINQSVIF